MTPRTHDTRVHRRLTGAVALALGALLGGAGLVWAWNTLVADLFAGPPIRFRPAAAAEVLAAVLILVDVARARLRRLGPSRRSA